MSKNKENTKVPVTDLYDSDEEHYFSENIESFGKMVWKRFRRHKLAVTGSIILILLVAFVLIGPMFSPYDPNEPHMELVNAGMPGLPSAENWLGTDLLGRDFLTRLMYGGRTSLLVGFVATGIGYAIGIPIGCVCGYFAGKWIDILICRFMEIFNSIPQTFLILTVIAIFTPSVWNIVIILGLFSWTGSAHTVRTMFLSLKSRDYVQSAYSAGMKMSTIMFKHILPNALTPIIIGASSSVSGAIMMESGLSYLGIGVTEPDCSWGSMLSKGSNFMLKAPVMAIAPGICIFLTSLSLCFIGDGLRDALDPRTKV